MKSIKLLLIVLFFFASQIYAQDNWTPKNNGITTTINSITFFNADTGIVVGVGGTIFRTVNGGKNWTRIEGATGSTNTAFSPNEILAEDHNSSRSNLSQGVGIVVGNGGTIKRSTNMGLTWKTITSNTSQNINGITNDGTNYPEEFVYAVGDSGLILKSSDDGLTWTQQASGTTEKLNSVTFFNADTGIAVGNNGAILRTTDGGKLWRALSGGSTAYSPNEILAENFNSSRSNINNSVSPGNGIIVGNGGTILRSTDFGLNWSAVSSGTGSSLLGLAFKDSSLTVVGDNGTVLVSSDFGKNWQTETSRTTAQLRAVEIAIKEEGVNRYMGGSGGALFKAATSQFSITSPTTGNTWYTGTSQTITWSGGDPGWNVSIMLIDFNSWTTYSTLNSNTLNDGSDVWNIPSTIPTGQYQIYVQEVNQLDWKYSGTFTIANQNTSNTWSALGTGLDNAVQALAVIGTDLYAGGSFTTAGGVSANSVAKWDGVNWSPLGSGMNTNTAVQALAVIGTNLYAGGQFTTAGGVSANYVAKWNGSTWSALGSGMNGHVFTLVVMGTDLYAGGNFTTAGGVSANNIARWDGSSWSPLGNGMNYPVTTLVVMGTDLYAGGNFTTAGGLNASSIAKWNGSTWSTLGNGMNNTADALAAIGTNLFAGGTFTTAGGISANYIAKWDATSWSPLGNGTNGILRALTVMGTELYAGGDFSTAGSVSANNITTWDGSSWSPLGSGMNNAVLTLIVIGTDIFAGGHFTAAGGVSANYVAKWGSVVTGIKRSSQIPSKFTLLQNFPNPFNPSTTFRYQLPQAANVQLIIYNTLGQVVRILVENEQSAGEYEVRWDGRDNTGRTVASGVYLYRIRTGTFVQTRKMLLLK